MGVFSKTKPELARNKAETSPKQRLAFYPQRTKQREWAPTEEHVPSALLRFNLRKRNTDSQVSDTIHHDIFVVLCRLILMALASEQLSRQLIHQSAHSFVKHAANGLRDALAHFLPDIFL